MYASRRFGVTLLLSLCLHRFLPPLFNNLMDSSSFTKIHAGDLISPDQAAEVIVTALADPASVPLACINMLIYSYDVLFTVWMARNWWVPGDNFHKKVFRRYRDVLRCTMRFLDLQSSSVFSSKHSNAGHADAPGDRKYYTSSFRHRIIALFPPSEIVAYTL
jgi:hypothetical protein